MDYQKEAMRFTQPVCKNWNNVGLGLTGEAGSIAKMIKRYMFHGEMLDKDRLIEELGDLCWYIALACEQLGISFNTMLANNIAKLSNSKVFDPEIDDWFDEDMIQNYEISQN